jgi:RNA polymerase sigma-70 factor (ECF subfamily)
MASTNSLRSHASGTQRSDAELLRGAERDPAAFRELYERYATTIYAYMERRTRQREIAYDLTAETFAQAWQSRRRFRDRAGGSVGPWLFGIARNVLLMSVRAHRLELSAAKALRLSLQSDAGGVQPAEEWLHGLDELLEDLSESQRQAVALRVFDDLSYAEIGRALGTTTGTARVRVHRALALLRRRFDHKEPPR